MSQSDITNCICFMCLHGPNGDRQGCPHNVCPQSCVNNTPCNDTKQCSGSFMAKCNKRVDIVAE